MIWLMFDWGKNITQKFWKTYIIEIVVKENNCPKINFLKNVNWFI